MEDLDKLLISALFEVYFTLGYVIYSGIFYVRCSLVLNVHVACYCANNVCVCVCVCLVYICMHTYASKSKSM